MVSLLEPSRELKAARKAIVRVRDKPSMSFQFQGPDVNVIIAIKQYKPAKSAYLR